MNRSGAAIGAILRFYKLTPADLLVVLDDFNLELGSLRLKPRGSAGGHNGLQSIIDCLGTSDFKRLRLGLGAPVKDHADYVLADFSKSEKKKVDEVAAKAAAAVLFFSRNGLEKTMSRFNAPDKNE
jgi:PTH1 family peptidyl-tRNA hydrolase